MNIGMLWYDNDKGRSLAEKVARAADYYRAKFGAQPTDCYVNRKALPDGVPPLVGSVRLHASRTVLPNHLWLGVSTDERHDGFIWS